MKCPKCGSKEVIEQIGTGEIACLNCGYSGSKELEPELSTAEKLLWLAENVGVLSNRYRLHILNRSSGKVINFYWHENGRCDNGDPDVENIAVADLSEAINAAYEWARKEQI